MELIYRINTRKKLTLLLLFLLFVTLNTNAQQRIRLGLHFDPLISWFGTDIGEVNNDGARPGINFGLSFNRSFTSNYSFSTGVNLVSAAGRLTHSDTTKLVPHDSGDELITVPPDESVLYKIQYVEVPIGLKLKTNEIGYITFFSDVGVDPKILVGGKMDIPALNIEGEKAMEELKLFNLSYHIIAGIEYGLGGNTSALLGLGFHNNFLDVTKDNGIQPEDHVTHKMVSVRLGINF